MERGSEAVALRDKGSGPNPGGEARSNDITVPPAPDLEYVFQACVFVAPPQELGLVNGVRRRVIPILGGDVEGPRLQAKVLPGGADWQSLRDGSVTDVLARYTLQASDGTLIGVTNAGLRAGPEDVIRRLVAGEVVDPALYYFRTAPVFEVAAGPHDWMARSLFLCTGERWPDRVVVRFYRVL